MTHIPSRYGHDGHTFLAFHVAVFNGRQIAPVKGVRMTRMPWGIAIMATLFVTAFGP
jgi:hypothetical protein